MAPDTLEPCGVRTPAHDVSENEWRDRIAAALKKLGYDDVQTEKRVEGGRIDIALAWHAVEIDWAYKWAEGVGQALFYGLRTGTKAVVLLLIDTPAGRRHADNARLVAKNNTPPLAVWTFDTNTRELDMGDGRTSIVE